jgi:hypothetical protein
MKRRNRGEGPLIQCCNWTRCRRLLFSVLVVSVLAGCTFHRQPYIAYEDKAHPLGDTSVMAIESSKARGDTLAQLTHVDGKELPSHEVGYPVWVRVLPGDHVFRVRHCTHRLMGGSIEQRCDLRSVSVANMLPRHLYVIDRVTAQVSHRGKDPKFGMTLGLRGVNQQTYPLSFGPADPTINAGDEKPAGKAAN